MPTPKRRPEAPSGSRGDLPDVNVWLALAAPGHPHHEAARAYWQQPDLPRLWFNRLTMLALVRLLCQSKVMGAAAMTLAQGLDVYGRFASLPEVAFMAEPEHCGEALLQWAGDGAGTVLPPRLWTDAYLAAFAATGDLRVVTFDREFNRFAGLNCLQLPLSAH